jgi:hypothetical protein
MCEPDIPKLKAPGCSPRTVSSIADAYGRDQPYVKLPDQAAKNDAVALAGLSVLLFCCCCAVLQLFNAVESSSYLRRSTYTMITGDNGRYTSSTWGAAVQHCRIRVQQPGGQAASCQCDTASAIVQLPSESP